jgi:hypothetical protein
VVQEAVVQEAVVPEAVVNEEIWRAWVKKGRLREQAEGRKFKLIAGIVLVLLVVASAYYWIR